jgi:nucleoside-diphosphate-sugar epimerase
MASILLIGLGDLGKLIAAEALEQGMAVQAMRRKAQGLPGVAIVQHDAATPWPALPYEFTDLILCVAPDNRSESAYQLAYLTIAKQALNWLQHHPKPAHVWVISSTSVYGQQSGEWVTENSPRSPERSTAKILVAAEDFWLKSGFACTMLRPAGLYGPGRKMMIETAKKALHFVENKPVYTNRIEISDCARAVIHLVSRRQQGLNTEIAYNLTDLNAARYGEVIQFLQQQLNIVPASEQHLTRGSKRVSASLLQQSGFCWLYPDYKAGYLALM